MAEGSRPQSADRRPPPLEREARVVRSVLLGLAETALQIERLTPGEHHPESYEQTPRQGHPGLVLVDASPEPLGPGSHERVVLHPPHRPLGEDPTQLGVALLGHSAVVGLVGGLAHPGHQAGVGRYGAGTREARRLSEFGQQRGGGLRADARELGFERSSAMRSPRSSRTQIRITVR